jgi:hypothetical protein
LVKVKKIVFGFGRAWSVSFFFRRLLSSWAFGFAALAIFVAADLASRFML